MVSDIIFRSDVTVELVRSSASDSDVLFAARVSTQGEQTLESASAGTEASARDMGLINYLMRDRHGSPFEHNSMTFYVQAPIFVFREWHRHRTQAYNEMSARYIPLPDENYVPTAERLRPSGDTNKQAQGTVAFDAERADRWLVSLNSLYALIEATYQAGLKAGVPKEVARVLLPVGRYSIMRASANLRNWLAFLKLRCDPAAQWEIRQYANAVAEIVAAKFPRTYTLAKEDLATT